jgi:hypothetical protein
MVEFTTDQLLVRSDFKWLHSFTSIPDIVIIVTGSYFYKFFFPWKEFNVLYIIFSTVVDDYFYSGDLFLWVKSVTVKIVISFKFWSCTTRLTVIEQNTKCSKHTPPRDFLEAKTPLQTFIVKRFWVWNLHSACNLLSRSNHFLASDNRIEIHLLILQKLFLSLKLLLGCLLVGNKKS